YSPNDIKDFPAAIILLTNKWYSKEASMEICKRFVQLAPSVDKKKEFVTYWLVDKKKLKASESNCGYLSSMYNYDAATIELYRIFKGRLENKNIIKNVYGKMTIRGPYIAIYEDEKRDTDLVIDLNRLGPKSTEYFLKNWSKILEEIEDRGSVKNPSAVIETAIENDKTLSDKEKEDLKDNLILWGKAGVCVGLAAAAATTTIAAIPDIKDMTLDIALTSGTEIKKKTGGFCGAIPEIVNK
ncbi:MAG: hypothetical protein I4N51_20230, partial [Acinetobacter sp.]|nr:hypothetical protein [Acinetobacter sp.]